MKLILSLLGLLVLTACGSDSGGGALQPAEAINRALTAISSGYDEIQPVFPVTPSCSQGQPTSSTPGSLSFPAEDVYCVLNTNNAGPETAQGAYFLISGLMCAIERTVDFSYDEVPNVQNGITISESDSCFGGSGVDIDGDGSASGSVLVSVFESSLTEGGFDGFVGVQLAATYNVQAVSPVQLFVKNSDSIVAVRAFQPNLQTFLDSSINTSNDTFSFEFRDYFARRHVRLFAEGSVSGSGNFSSVNSFQYIHTEGDASVSGSRSVISNFFNGAPEFDHHVNAVRASGFGPLTAIPHDIDFYSWTSRQITDINPLATGPIDLLNRFDMSFD